MKELDNSILDFIGNTPLVKLRRIVPKASSNVYIKLEEFNAGGSVKSRIALQMIIDAEKSGRLKANSGQTIIEPTGGNTGIGLAIVGAVRGYRVVLVVPDNYSKEKIAMLRAYGAEVTLSDSKTGNDSHIRKVKSIVDEHPEYVWLDQLSNPSNPKAHYENTGREILEILDQVDCFVAGMGSGGTVSGVGKRIKEKFPQAIVVGIQPVGCDVLNGRCVPHKIQGFAIGMLPAVLNRSIIDKMLSVTYEDAISFERRLAKEEGLLVGISSGANTWGSIQMAKELGEGKTVVTIAPDSGRSYLEVF